MSVNGPGTIEKKLKLVVVALAHVRGQLTRGENVPTNKGS